MYTTTLKTKAGSFDVKNDQIFTDNFTLPFSYNPYNCRLWVVCKEYGAVCAVWADNEQDALDLMLDKGIESFLISEQDFLDMTEDEKEEVCFLGNAGEPNDLTYCQLHPVVFEWNKETIELLNAFIVAIEREEDTLDFNL